MTRFLRIMPARTLVIVTTLVLLAHFFLLENASMALSLKDAIPPGPLTVRTIQLAAPVAPEEKPAKAQPAPPKPPRAPKQKLAVDTTPPGVPSDTREIEPPALVEYAQSAPKIIAQEILPPPVEEVAVPTPAPAASEPAGADVATTAQTFVMPIPVRMKYEVTGTKSSLKYFARAELLWKQDSVQYEARMEVSAFLIGSRIRTSTGRLGSQGLEPARFSDKYRSELAAHFDREKARVTFSNGPEIALQPGAQDQLSLFFQLGAMLAGDPAKFPKGTSISVQTVGPRSADNWVLTVEGTEPLQLPGGELEAVKLVRAPRKDYDQKEELWLAASQGYLPVRIRITQPDGDYVDQQWLSSDEP